MSRVGQSSKRIRDNKYSEAHSREHGYVIQVKCVVKDENNRKIHRVFYLDGFAYNNKYRNTLSIEDKKYICLGTVYFVYSHHYSLGDRGFISLNLLKLPILGINLSEDILYYASVFKDKSSCRKIVRDIEKHKQEILKAPFDRAHLKSIDDIKIVKV